MKKAIICILMLALFILPLINADLITPGFHSIPIINNITNFNDFSDYYLLSVCTMGSREDIYQVNFVEDDGNIKPCYKFTEMSVYAIKKTDFNLIYFNNLTEQPMFEEDHINLKNYLNSINKIQVIENIEHYKTVPISTTQTSITNYYTINLNKVLSKPNDSRVERNNLIYVYISAAVLALIIILIIILIRRRK